MADEVTAVGMRYRNARIRIGCEYVLRTIPNEHDDTGYAVGVFDELNNELGVLRLEDAGHLRHQGTKKAVCIKHTGRVLFTDDEGDAVRSGAVLKVLSA